MPTMPSVDADEVRQDVAELVGQQNVLSIRPDQNNVVGVGALESEVCHSCALHSFGRR